MDVVWRFEQVNAAENQVRSNPYYHFTKFHSQIKEKKFEKGTKANKRGEAPSEAANTNFTTWLSVLNKIRTFFKENPDADF